MRVRALVALAVAAAGLGWVLTRGLSGNLVYFLTPTELLASGPDAVGERVRLGGQVVPGSVDDGSSAVRFVVTDGTTRVTVVGPGEVPALFRSGIGVVVEGIYGADGAFHADTVLIKHSEEYRPPAPGETPHSAKLEGG
ncbi:MAG: cytochrome c maturation protein CcmE [Actinomycetota bacterium]